MNPTVRRPSWRGLLALGLFLVGGLALTLWPGAKAQEPVPDPSLPTVQFAASSYTASEGDGIIAVTITLSEAATEAVSVSYLVSGGGSGGSQIATDVVVEGTIDFAPGETSKTVEVPIEDDSCCQGTVNVTASLSNPVGATLGAPATTTVTILDNDVCP